MFSLDNKQWENVAEGLLSSVTKAGTQEPGNAASETESKDEKVIDFVAVRSDER